MKKRIKLYNVIFPIWMLLFLPPAWLVVFPANFAIDSLVFRLGAKFAKLQNILAVYKKSILKIFGRSSRSWIFIPLFRIGETFLTTL